MAGQRSEWGCDARDHNESFGMCEQYGIVLLTVVEMIWEWGRVDGYGRYGGGMNEWGWLRWLRRRISDLSELWFVFVFFLILITHLFGLLALILCSNCSNTINIVLTTTGSHMLNYFLKLGGSLKLAWHPPRMVLAFHAPPWLCTTNPFTPPPFLYLIPPPFISQYTTQTNHQIHNDIHLQVIIHLYVSYFYCIDLLSNVFQYFSQMFKVWFKLSLYFIKHLRGGIQCFYAKYITSVVC